MNELRAQLASQREKLSKSEQSSSQEGQTTIDRRKRAELLRCQLREIAVREAVSLDDERSLPEQQSKPDSKNEQADENELSRLLAEIAEIRESVDLAEAKRVFDSQSPVLRKIEENFGWFRDVEGNIRGNREYSVDAVKELISEKKEEAKETVLLLQNSAEESRRVERQFDAAKACVDEANRSLVSLVDTAPDRGGESTGETDDTSQSERQWAKAIEQCVGELYGYGLEKYPGTIEDLYDRAHNLLSSGLDNPGEANVVLIESVIELAQRARTANMRIGEAIDEFSNTLNNAVEAEARRTENQ